MIASHYPQVVQGVAGNHWGSKWGLLWLLVVITMIALFSPTRTYDLSNTTLNFMELFRELSFFCYQTTKIVTSPINHWVELWKQEAPQKEFGADLVQTGNTEERTWYQGPLPGDFQRLLFSPPAWHTAPDTFQNAKNIIRRNFFPCGCYSCTCKQGLCRVALFKESCSYHS